MSELPETPVAFLELAVRVGCKLRYETAFVALMLLNIKPRHDAFQLVTQELPDLAPVQATSECEDDQGNIVLRSDLRPGGTKLIYDTNVRVPAENENYERGSGDPTQSPAEQLT